MKTRFKKYANARILTIRTQWGKANDPAYLLDWNGLPFEEMLTFNKSNPNNNCGFYTPTYPYTDAIDYTHDNVIENIDAEEDFDFLNDPDVIEYLQNIWNTDEDEVLI